MRTFYDIFIAKTALGRFDNVVLLLIKKDPSNKPLSRTGIINKTHGDLIDHLRYAQEGSQELSQTKFLTNRQFKISLSS